MEDLIDFNSPEKSMVKEKKNEPIDIKMVSPECSFQVLNESVLDHGSISFSGRPSILLPDALNALNDQSGRESLGILHTLPADNDLLTPVGYDRKLSNFSSLSSIHSLELSKPSKIFSVDSQFNNGFVSSFSETYFLDIPSILNKKFMEVKDLKLRLHSMPDVPLKKPTIEEDLKEKAKSVAIERKSSSEECYSLEPDDFNDSVFLEAHHIASKIGDGSILDNSSDEYNELDCTPQPNWEDVSDIEDQPEANEDPEIILKKLDKLIPAIKLNDEEEKECPIHETSASINNQDNFNSSKSSASSNKSKGDHKEMIQNLSDILQNKIMDSEQKRAGQNLLADIANLLNCNKRNTNSDDSGHSSIDPEDGVQHLDEHKCYEVLDLSNKASTSECNLKPMDLSLNKNTNRKRLTQSFSFPSPKMPPPTVSNNLKDQAATLKNIVSSMEGTRCNLSDSRVSSASSTGSLPSVTNTKLKSSKKLEKSKIGPLRAIISMNVLIKSKDFYSMKPAKSGTGLTTPTRRESHSSIYKRTSTPIAESNYKKPVAQSTPESKPIKKNSKLVGCSTDLRKRKLSCPISPLTHTFSSQGDASGTKSGSSINNISNKSAMSRRFSSSDVKNANTTNRQLRRSLSVGKENALPLNKSDRIDDKSKKSLPNKSAILKRSNIKPFNLAAKLDDVKNGGRKSFK